MRLDGLILFGLGFAVLPGLEGYKEECVIGSPGEAEQTETNDAGGVLNPWSLCEHRFYLFRSLACAFQGRRIGQLHVDVEVALVFIRHEAGGQMIAKKPRRNAGNDKQHHHHSRLPDQVSRPADKAVGGAIPILVEPAKEFSQRSTGLLLWLEQQRCQRRAKRESVERRKYYGDRDGNGKLLIQSAGDPWNESCRHEHRSQD